jgi:hypothetical protein
MIRAVEAVLAVEKVWIPADMSQAITFFSDHDVWAPHGYPDEKICDRCADFIVSPLYHGDTLQSEFPYLEIEDIDLIKVNIHPNCRCWLSRVQEE